MHGSAARSRRRHWRVQPSVDDLCPSGSARRGPSAVVLSTCDARAARTALAATARTGRRVQTTRAGRYAPSTTDRTAGAARAAGDRDAA